MDRERVKEETASRGDRERDRERQEREREREREGGERDREKKKERKKREKNKRNFVVKGGLKKIKFKREFVSPFCLLA